MRRAASNERRSAALTFPLKLPIPASNYGEAFYHGILGKKKT